MYMQRARAAARVRGRVRGRRIARRARRYRIHTPRRPPQMMWLRLLGCASWALCSSAGSPSTDPNMNGDYKLSKTPGVRSARTFDRKH
eukprot:COSAG02_NODE_3915_length_6050_cov_22.279281_6_plen_88_part_00